MISSVADLYPGIIPGLNRDELLCLPLAFPGLRIFLRSNRKYLLDAVNRIYGNFRKDPPPDGEEVSMYLLQEGDRFLAVDPGFKSFVLPAVEDSVAFWAAQLMNNHLYRCPFFYIHGAVMAHEGAAFIFAGGSGGGKSALSLKLLAAGWGFLSDEFAVFDPIERRVFSFPRALLIRGEEPRSVSPSENLPREIGGIFLLDGFSPGPTDIDPVDPAVFLRRLVPLIVNRRFLQPGEKVPFLEGLFALLEESTLRLIRPGSPLEDPRDLATRVWASSESSLPESSGLEMVKRECLKLLPE